MTKNSETKLLSLNITKLENILSSHYGNQVSIINMDGDWQFVDIEIKGGNFSGTAFSALTKLHAKVQDKTRKREKKRTNGVVL